MMTAPTDDIPVPAIRPIWLRPFIGQLLWTAVILWAIWILRFFLLFFGYGLTGDHDPEAVYRLSHLGTATVLFPAMLLPMQWPEFLLLFALIAFLVVFKRRARKHGTAGAVA